MIVIDTSALIALLLNEQSAPALRRRLSGETERVMSTANYVEAGAVMARRQQLEPSRAILELENILSDTAITLIPVDERQARLALDARIHFGHGFGARAGLNFGDSFAYALAKALDAPLLFVGDDFRETDITPAV